MLSLLISAILAGPLGPFVIPPPLADYCASGTCSSHLTLTDDLQLRFGAAPDYWLEYVSASNVLRLRTTNGDGAGTDATIWTVTDGGKLTRYFGDIRLDTNNNLDFGSGPGYWIVYTGSALDFASTDIDGAGTDGVIFSLTDGQRSLTLGATSQVVMPITNDATKPPLSDADRDSGIYWLADDYMGLSLAGVIRWSWTGGTLQAGSATGPAMVSVASGATTATVIPNRGDSDNGLGSAGSDTVTLVAGGVEGLTVSEGIGTAGEIQTRLGAGCTFANLGTPANGTFCYCTNCNIATPCTTGGTGAWAFRSVGAWKCPF